MKKVERVCPICGTVYLAYLSRLKLGKESTCSRKCSYIYRGNKQRATKTLECFYCKKLFTRKPSWNNRTSTPFCSLKCFRLTRAEKLMTFAGPPTKPTLNFICEQCNKTVILLSSLKGARKFRFCCYECATEWHRGINHHHWRGGSRNSYGSNWTRQRRFARKRDNFTCQQCRITESEYGKRLDVHHIIRFSNFDDYKEANQLSNLITLCHTCHLKMEWATYPNPPLSDK